MARMDQLSTYCTTIARTPEGRTIVTYHSTAIVEFDREQVTLRTGGWDTVTTRRKMNQTARQFGLGFNVYRNAGESFIKTPQGQTLPLDSVVSFAL